MEALFNQQAEDHLTQAGDKRLDLDFLGLLGHFVADFEQMYREPFLADARPAVLLDTHVCQL